MKYYLKHARLFGISCLLSFLFYAAGTTLMNTVPDPVQILAHQNRILTGSILVVILHTISNLGMLTAMFTLLRTFKAVLSYLYFSFGCFATMMLALGGIFLTLPVSLSQPPDQHTQSFELLFSFCQRANFYVYQSGMCLWGAGGLILCYLLHRTKLVPVFFPLLGYAGYSFFIAGTLLELFGYPFGVMLSAPGGLFELMLGCWLIIKGFSKTTDRVEPSVS